MLSAPLTELVCGVIVTLQGTKVNGCVNVAVRCMTLFRVTLLLGLEYLRTQLLVSFKIAFKVVLFINVSFLF